MGERRAARVAGVAGGEAGGGVADEEEQVADRKLVELGQGAAVPLPAERLGLEAGALAIGAGVVGPVARQEDAHVHLVRVLFQPAEKALQAVPVLRPGLAVLLAVAGFAVDDEALLFRGKRRERNVRRDFFLPREDKQIVLGVAVDLALPALDRAVVDRARVVRHREPVIDLDDAAETTALRTCAERGVEREKRGRGGAESSAGLRRVQATGEMAQFMEASRGRRSGRIAGGGRRRFAEEVHFALAEMERGFDGLEKTRLRRGVERHPILHHENRGRRQLRPQVGRGQREELVDSMRGEAGDRLVIQGRAGG